MQPFAPKQVFRIKIEYVLLLHQHHLLRANRLLPQTPPPSNPFVFLFLTKQKNGAKAPFFVWCGRRDLNPHGLPQEPETCASANFATSAFSPLRRERRYGFQSSAFHSVFLTETPSEPSRTKTFPLPSVLTGSPSENSSAALFSIPQARNLLYNTVSSKSSVLSL